MTNIIILFCCILSGFLVGRHLSKRIKDKENFFYDLTRYLSLLKVNVKGRCVELHHFNKEFATSCAEPFANLLLSNKVPTFLDANQKQLVTSIFANLSATTSTQLLSNIDYFEQLIANQVDGLSNTFHNGKMYSKLGVLLGVMVGILLM